MIHHPNGEVYVCETVSSKMDLKIQLQFKMSPKMFSILGGELQRHSDLVASLAKGASVDESREGDRDPVPQFLLVAETHLKIRIGLRDCIWNWDKNWI